MSANDKVNAMLGEHAKSHKLHQVTKPKELEALEHNLSDIWDMVDELQKVILEKTLAQADPGYMGEAIAFHMGLINRHPRLCRVAICVTCFRDAALRCTDIAAAFEAIAKRMDKADAFKG